VNNGCPYYLPNVPADKIVVDPSNPTLLYLATDMGIFRGCLGCRSADNLTCNASGATFICNANGTVWVWDKLTTGFPQAAWVTDLTLHQDARVLRAWTYGRSVWEAQLPSIPNPDRVVNATSPTTDAQPPAIGSTTAGNVYAITWSDDRNGMNNWHVRYRTFNGDGTYIDLLDRRVDDTTDHVALGPAVAPNSTATTHEQCSWVTWHDDRLGRTNHINHIFYTYICGDGFKPYADVRADTQDVTLNATFPAATFEPTSIYLEFAAAWQADRNTNAPPPHDIYARFFSAFGPKAPPFQVNAQSLTSDATLPATTADANSNVYIAWEEHEPGANPPAEYKILLSKFDLDGVLQNARVRVDGGNPANTPRHRVAIAVDSQAGSMGPYITVTWDEMLASGTTAVFRRQLQLTSSGPTYRDTNPVQINLPPLVPAGAQQAYTPTVGTDANNNLVIGWQANVNVSDGSLLFDNFAKGFNSAAAVLKNDFRVDLAGRAATRAARMSRSSLAGQFAYAWRDQRSGHFDVYTRVVPSLQ